jgi:predicted AAA+ superfamily ATPase
MPSAPTSYLQHWGLSAPAFLNPDQNFEPTSIRRAQIVVELLQILTSRSGIVVVSGAKGVGKSALLKHLAALMPNCIYSVYSAGNVGWLKKRIDQHFCGSKGDSNQSLAQILGLLYEKKVLLTCIIDVVQVDAHFWPAIDELVTANYLPNHFFNFVIALPAQEQKPLSAPEQRLPFGEPTKWVQLEPFSREECHDVVSLLAAKLLPKALTEGHIDDLFSQSQGVPERLLSLAENLLIEAYAASTHILRISTAQTEQRRGSEDLTPRSSEKPQPKRQQPRVASLSSLVVKRPDKQ